MSLAEAGTVVGVVVATALTRHIDRQFPFQLACIRDVTVRRRTSPDWEWASKSQSNTLVQGPEPSTDIGVSKLRRHSPAPVVTVETFAAVPLATVGKGSVILETVGRYSLAEQREILSWLDAAGSGVRIITTTSERLFDLVEAGRFIDTLYYRLNIIFLDLDSEPPTA